MKYIYSDNVYSVEVRDEHYRPGAEQVSFDYVASEIELLESFPNRSAMQESARKEYAAQQARKERDSRLRVYDSLTQIVRRDIDLCGEDEMSQLQERLMSLHAYAKKLPFEIKWPEIHEDALE
jgi:hypothetical protein